MPRFTLNVTGEAHDFAVFLSSLQVKLDPDSLDSNENFAFFDFVLAAGFLTIVVSGGDVSAGGGSCAQEPATSSLQPADLGRGE